VTALPRHSQPWLIGRHPSSPPHLSAAGHLPPSPPQFTNHHAASVRHRSGLNHPLLANLTRTTPSSASTTPASTSSTVRLGRASYAEGCFYVLLLVIPSAHLYRRFVITTIITAIDLDASTDFFYLRLASRITSREPTFSPDSVVPVPKPGVKGVRNRD
jgi:hypothetical protein